MLSTKIAGNRTFSFKVAPLQIVDKQEDDFELLATIDFDDIEYDVFHRLCVGNDLRVGLKIYRASSSSEIIVEYRAQEVLPGGRSNQARARFVVARSVFAEQQCRLAQIDLLYENGFWFSDRTGPQPYLPIWVERPAREVDIFDHYFKTYAAR